MNTIDTGPKVAGVPVTLTPPVESMIAERVSIAGHNVAGAGWIEHACSLIIPVVPPGKLACRPYPSWSK
jgi:hypothetical protein